MIKLASLNSALAPYSPICYWLTKSIGQHLRAQSALLEAMAEAQVSVDGKNLQVAQAIHGHCNSESN